MTIFIALLVFPLMSLVDEAVAAFQKETSRRNPKGATRISFSLDDMRFKFKFDQQLEQVAAVARVITPLYGKPVILRGLKVSSEHREGYGTIIHVDLDYELVTP